VCSNLFNGVRETCAVNAFEVGEGSRPQQVISTYRVMHEFRDVSHKHWSIPPPHFGNCSERDTRTVIIVSRSGCRPLDGRPLYHVDIKMFSFHATKDAGYLTLITSYCSPVSDVRTCTGDVRGRG
jgi:hypothetical protein